MKILIVTVGTRGDVQPFLALALGLKAAGHQVAICTCPKFKGFVSERGIEYYHLDGGLIDLLESDLGRAIFESLNGLVGVLKSIPKVLKTVGPIHRRMFADCWAATEAMDPDLIVYHPKMFCVPAIAAKRKIPAVLAMLCPMHVPTGESPLFGPSMGRTYNRATYRMVHLATKLGTRSYFRNWRAEHDPEGASRWSGPTQISPSNPVTVIHGYSPSLCPPPKDWPQHASVTGYWFMPSDSSNASLWEPSKELSAFLESGPAPVYIGFGSIAGSNAESTTLAILEAIKLAKVRAVLATGWGGITSTTHSQSIHVLESAPHEWLFPKMAAVVHHGGAGTTAAGLRAGCPTIVCPFGLDQPFWGRCVFESGVGGSPILQKKLTAERLAEAIKQALSNQSIRVAASRMAASIAKEQGVTNAINKIESVYNSSK